MLISAAMLRPAAMSGRASRMPESHRAAAEAANEAETPPRRGQSRTPPFQPSQGQTASRAMMTVNSGRQTLL